MNLGPERECAVCGKKCNGWVGLASHASQTHKINSQAYYDQYIRETSGECIECGAKTTFINMANGYRPHCSYDCANRSLDRIEKVKATKLARYGDENYNNIEKQKKTYALLDKGEIQRKIAATFLEKYGAENIFASEYGKQKIKETMLDRYGVENSMHLDETKEKVAMTNLERYGAETVFASEHGKQKAKETRRERYGDENYNNRELAKETAKNAISEIEKKYNCISVAKLIDKYGAHWTKFNVVEFHNYYNTYLFVDLNDVPKIEEFISKNCGRSLVENLIYNRIEEVYDGDILVGKRSIIAPYELDLYLPELKLAIEFNGTYYHSTEMGKPEDYHLNKSLLCREKGIRLVHIYEFEDLDEQTELLISLVKGEDLFPKGDFNKNNFLEIPKPELIFKNDYYTVYGAGKLASLKSVLL